MTHPVIEAMRAAWDKHDPLPTDASRNAAMQAVLQAALETVVIDAPGYNRAWLTLCSAAFIVDTAPTEG